MPLAGSVFKTALKHKKKVLFGAAGAGVAYSIFKPTEQRQRIVGDGRYENMFKTDVFEDESRHREQFQWFASALDKFGTEVGTGHKRVLVPKAILDEEELEDLGFVGVNIAIPEAGQESLRSFRNIRNKLHMHEFKDYWTMHEDIHEASTMRIKKEELEEGEVSTWSAIKHTIAGLPHVITEGLPGLFYWGRGQIAGTTPMDVRLKQELPVEYLRFINREAKEMEPDYEWQENPIFFQNRFSGRDDEYNTIEGLRHGGFAQQTRQELTAFGSGWRGLFKGIFGKGKQSVQQLAKREGITIAKDVEEYVRAVAGKGISEEVIKGQAEKMRLAGPLSFVKGKVIYGGNEKVFAYDVLKGSAEYGTKRYKQLSGALKELGLYHEIAEVKYGEYAQRAFGKDIEKLKKLKFGSHWSPQVIKREAEFARELGKTGVEAAAALRKTEGIDITRSISQKEIVSTVRDLRTVNRQIRKGATDDLLARQAVLKQQYYKQKTAHIYQSVLHADVDKARRMAKFRQSSTEAVGIGLRYANNAGKGHAKFNSTSY